MNSLIALLRLQMKQLRWTMIAFWMFLAGFIFFMGWLYPGDQSMKDLVQAFQSLSFFIGSLPPSSTNYYGYWYSIMITTFAPLFLLAAGLFLGVDVVTREEADKTFDIGFSVPQSRLSIFIVRLFGGLVYIIITGLIGLISSDLIDIAINKIINITILEQLWLSITFQAIFGFALGVLIGSILFDRGFGFQIAFIYLALSYIFTLVIEDLANLTLVIANITTKNIIDFLNIFNIYNYLKVDDILFRNSFQIQTLYPILIASIALIIIAGIIFINRNLLETEFQPLYVYLNPFYWSKGKQTNKNAVSKTENKINTQDTQPHGFSFSRILISWSKRFQYKAPIFVDELTAHGLFLLIYAILVFLGIFLQLITYPGDAGALQFLKGFQSTPIYLLISDNYDITTKPYLGFAIAQYLSFTWLYFLPFIVYRFYHMELRDNGKTDEIFYAGPVSKQQIFLQRCIAIFVEYYIIIIIACIGFILPEILLQKTSDTYMEILTSFFTGPLYLSLGLFISVVISYLPKFGKYLAVGGVLAAFIFYLVGSLNKNILFLAQITPFYYYNPVSFLYGGIQFTNIFPLVIFCVIIVILILIRALKSERYLTT